MENVGLFCFEMATFTETKGNRHAVKTRALNQYCNKTKHEFVIFSANLEASGGPVFNKTKRDFT